jgi:hypothetical protein
MCVDYRATVAISELLNVLRGLVDRFPEPVPAAGTVASAVSKDVNASLSADVAALQLSPPAMQSPPVAGRLSLTRHQDRLPPTIPDALFGSYLTFVNRQPQCNELVVELQDTYDKFKQQLNQPSAEYIRSLNVVYSGGAPGIGQCTSALCIREGVLFPARC